VEKSKKKVEEVAVAAVDAHVTGEISGGVLIASVIVASVSLWAVALASLFNSGLV
jgi:molybdopterin-binding protein